MPPRDPTAAVVRNALALRGTENRIARELARLFDEKTPELVRLLIKWDLTAVSRGFRPRRQRALDRDMSKVLDELYKEVAAITGSAAVDIGQIQEAFATSQLQRAVGAVGIDLGGRDLGRAFWRSLLATDPIQGSPLSEWWATQKRGTRVGLRRQIRLGMAQQETLGTIVRRLRTVLPTSVRGAQAVARTAINHVATEAHFQTYKAHQDVTEEYQYVATLDTRTTPICQSLDGKTWTYDDPNGRRPPQHVNCRSTIVPLVDFEGLGLPTPPEGKRAAVGGPVPAGQTYQQWLRKQSKAVQEEALGPARAKLFRGNRATLDDFVRDTGKIVTLDELKRAG